MSSIGWVFGVLKGYGVNTKGMSVEDAFEKLNELEPNKGKREKPEPKKVDREKQEEKLDALRRKVEGGSPSDAPKQKLAVGGKAAEKLYNDISSGKLYDTEQLREHPVVKELDNLAEEYNKKYGVTANITTPERERMRKQWEEDFLSAGSMTQVGKDEKGHPIYEPKGKIRKEHKAVVVIGLPAAGKSTAVANPVSEQNGAFIFDSDEIKGYIPEFKESNGGAANAVHDESKQILKSAFSKFLDGGERNGENLVIPIIGDDIGKRGSGKGVLGKWVEPLEKSGYDVEIKFKDADPKESMNRVFMRAIKTGRVIPSKVVLGYGDKPRGVFEEFKKLKNSKGEPYVR